MTTAEPAVNLSVDNSCDNGAISTRGAVAAHASVAPAAACARHARRTRLAPPLPLRMHGWRGAPAGGARG